MGRLHLCMLTAMFSAASSSRASVSSAYAQFRESYRSRELRARDDVPHATRQAIFEARVAEVQAHNARPHATWTAEINRFADFTDAELAAMRGYRRSGGRWSAPAPPQSSFLEARPEQAIAKSADWRQRLSRSASPSFLQNQGACGSCWAVAAVGVLEMHAEIAGDQVEPLSFEQLVDCVENPRHCGGTGGCHGATAELAFKYVAEHGLLHADHYRGYQSGGDGTCRPSASPGARIASYTTLPVNELVPLKRALSTQGPVVASVEASDWSIYGQGVFDGCSINATVNHAVVMVGYGTDDAQGKYYLIRNSWGPDWGEGGYIRLRRHDTDQGLEGYCGVDKNPKEGVGCDGGPSEIPVCGMCGVLSDSAFPTGVRSTPAIGSGIAF